MEKIEVTLTVHFAGGTKLSLKFPRQAGNDPVLNATGLRKALESDKIVAEVDGNLIVIPFHNVTYISLSPAPPDLPKGIIRNAKL